ncbi:electron transfer flavoprotein subunit beta/FixA family protein [Streptomyces iranensis]|uniref:Electron transfer flavoprotein subunit beta n=1 Tax=Streptomyces iranensis TaxID=576784 RepID=A0A060ZZP4_9ACTN|nr:electron transfer flavoprotein subunit beta/FixA family protein [Streptomyces iranensis]MBP2060094.1 electron transfer flavoprotein beta subunit [Streptomyces iranensis]CDR13995.1 Electron transfer flavoprotein alpha/beta-subunit [Streptomyces iranensis]
MNIVVCVKYVPAAADRTFSAVDNTVDRADVDGMLCELDEHAVEEALRITEADGGEVTVVTVGPEEAADAIARGLRMGAHRGVHIVDDALHGSDAAATSLVLAAAVRKTGYDIVLCGMASTDGGMGVVPAMLAERLGVPQLTLASQVTVEGGTVTIRRESSTATEHIEASGPLVLSVTDRSNEPRYPSFKGIMAAKKKPVETWSLADLGIASEVGLEAAGTTVSAFAARPARTGGQIVSDEGEGGARLAEYLVAQKLV